MRARSGSAHPLRSILPPSQRPTGASPGSPLRSPRARPARDLGHGGPQLGLAHVVEQQPRRPAASASSISRGSLTSTSSVPASSGALARARATAWAIPPAAAMWFSLIRIASYSPARWLLAPPAATAAFSSARRPGIVLRVSSTPAPVPCTSREARAASVATPDRWVRKFSAVRSALSRARARPSPTSPARPPRATHPPRPSSRSAPRDRALRRRSRRPGCRR